MALPHLGDLNLSSHCFFLQTHIMLTVTGVLFNYYMVALGCVCVHFSVVIVVLCFSSPFCFS